VLGAGLMGHAIAQVFATAGHPVTVVDHNPEVFAPARAKIQRNLGLLVEYQLLGPEQAEQVPDRIQFATELEAVAPCQVVIESITEDVELKRALFRELAPLLASDAILTTNSSSIPLRDLADATGRPDRFTTTHFFRPAYIVLMVEVTKGAQTSQATVETVIGLLQGAGWRPVRVNVDLPGQVANRLRQALFREGLDLVERGVVSAEDLDRLAAFSFGPRMPLMGVIKDRDLVGLEITKEGADRVWPDLCAADRPHPRLQDLVAGGHLGLKTGRGLYDWSEVDFADYWETMERQQLEIFQTLRRTGVLED
jgi:3-hydroxyacyl-CoA dehydrogenase